jgi:hypothetical protein
MSLRERSPISNDARKADRGRRVGGSACVLCGEIDPAVLVAVDRSLLEFHHTAGAANDPTLGGWLCRNCHAVATAAQRDVGVELRHRDDRHAVERLEAALRSLASFFALLAERLFAWADRLASLVATLDASVPQWRVVTEGL